MSNLVRWPCRVAAVLAAAVGTLLLLGGWGHLSAVLAARNGQPFDYRFVSLLTTSGILMFPGLVSLAASYWLWRGRTWAYASCLVSTVALMLYLGLLIYMKAEVPADSTSAGSEVYVFAALTCVYLVGMAAVVVWLNRGRGLMPSGA